MGAANLITSHTENDSFVLAIATQAKVPPNSTNIDRELYQLTHKVKSLQQITILDGGCTNHLVGESQVLHNSVLHESAMKVAEGKTSINVSHKGDVVVVDRRGAPVFIRDVFKATMPLPKNCISESQLEIKNDWEMASKDGTRFFTDRSWSKTLQAERIHGLHVVSFESSVSAIDTSDNVRRWQPQNGSHCTWDAAKDAMAKAVRNMWTFEEILNSPARIVARACVLS